MTPSNAHPASGTLPAKTPALTPAPSRLRRFGLYTLVLVAVPLLVQLSPRYDASGVAVAPLALALALALAVTARLGWRVLPVLLLGAGIGACGWPLAAPEAPAVAAALTLLLQTAFGGLLMRRSSRPDDLALDNNPAIRRLVAAALGVALVGAAAELLQNLLDIRPEPLRPGLVALVRATADGGSVLIGVPLVLAFIAPQRQRWQARRATVALPLALLLLLLLVAFTGIDARDRLHAQQRFDRDAEIVFARSQALLDAPQQALIALAGAQRMAPLSGPGFDVLARPWVARTGGLVQVGLLELPRGDAAAPATGPASVRHVLSRSGGAGGAPGNESEGAAAAAAARHAPAQPPAQEAMVVSPPIALPGSGGERTGFILYQVLPADPLVPQRQAVFATVLADPLITPLTALRDDALRVCLADIDNRAQPRRLYGAEGCESGLAREGWFSHEAAFDFGGRRWLLQVSQPVRTPGSVWLFALPALAGCGLLAVLLLAMTGRVQRVEADARHRTDELQHEIDHLRQLQLRGEQALAGAFEAAQTGLALLERDGRVQRASAAFAALLDTTPDKLLRRGIDELLVDDDRGGGTPVAAMMQDAGDELAHRSMRLRLPGGRVLPALVTLRVLREPDGRAAAAVCALHDLSDNLRRRQAERVLGDVLDLSGHNPPTLPPRSGRAIAAPRILGIHRDATHAALPRAALAARSTVQLSIADSSTLDAGQLLAQVQAEAPHLLLLDAELSGSDGLDLLRRLQADPATRAIPVIVLSEDPRPDRIDAAFSAGARAYLTRPVEARQLLAAIDELI